MKKFFSLFLIFALICSMSVNAMAMGWGQFVEIEGPKDKFELSITKLEYAPTAGAAGSGHYFKEYSGYVVKDTMIRAIITFEVPKAEELSRTVAEHMEALKLTIKTSNIANVNIEEYPSATIVTSPITNFSAGTKYQYMLTGVVKENGPATIEAILSFGLTFGQAFSYVFNGETFTATRDGASFIVSDSKGDAVIFGVDSNSKIKTVSVVAAGDMDEYLYKPNGEIALTKEQNEVLQKVCRSLGFSTGGSFGYIHEQGFINMYGNGFTLSQVAKYNSTSSGVVGNVSGYPSVPQTGDVPSIVGFAMLGAAVVACAIIAIRKKIYN